MEEIIIKVYCGLTVESLCRQQLRPLNEVKAAKSIIDLNKSMVAYSNSPDFVAAIRNYAKEKGVKTEFFLDGVSCDNNIDPIFEDFNKSLDLLDGLCKNTF